MKIRYPKSILYGERFFIYENGVKNGMATEYREDEREVRNYLDGVLHGEATVFGGNGDKMEFSYKDGEDFVFSDVDTYETISLTPEIVGEAPKYMTENAPVTIIFVGGNPVSVELPSSVVLTVAEAPEGIKGDSSNNVQKPITLETGIHNQAPLFIKTGEKIKVDTRNGKYMERAN